jgi:hypothetical protein
MEIRVRIEDNEPPIGSAQADGAPHPFVGWLGLLRVLAELLGSDLAGPQELDDLSARPNLELGENVPDVGVDRPG